MGQAAQDDVARGGAWGSERVVEASVLVDLLTQPVTGSEMRRSVRVRGARVVGSLDLDDATLSRPVWLQDCFFDERVTMNRAPAVAVHLTGSRLSGLQARQLRAQGDLDLTEVTATEIVLQGAQVAGALLPSDCITMITESGRRRRTKGPRPRRGCLAISRAASYDVHVPSGRASRCRG